MRARKLIFILLVSVARKLIYTFGFTFIVLSGAQFWLIAPTVYIVFACRLRLYLFSEE